MRRTVGSLQSFGHRIKLRDKHTSGLHEHQMLSNAHWKDLSKQGVSPLGTTGTWKALAPCTASRAWTALGVLFVDVKLGRCRSELPCEYLLCCPA